MQGRNRTSGGEWTCGHSGVRRGREALGEEHRHLDDAGCETDSWGLLCNTRSSAGGSGMT